MGSPPPAHQHTDWYRWLGLGPEASAADISAAIERLSRQANALSLTAPDRARQIRDQIRSIRQDLLAGGAPSATAGQQPARQGTPGGRQPVPQAPAPPSGRRSADLMARLTNFLQAGWACANCGYGALPADKFCPKCGSKIQPPAPAGSEYKGPGPVTAPPAKCQRCGRSLTPENAFCIWCGAQRA